MVRLVPWRLMLTIVYWVSVVTFVTCVVILFSGWCTRQGELTRPFRLEFISTQMAACLDEAPIVTYGVVAGSSIQMLVLLHFLLRCMRGDGTKNAASFCIFTVENKHVALLSAVLIANFAYSFAAVAEFKSNSPQFAERFLHIYAAVQTIFLFWAVHTVIVWYLKHFVHAPEYGYVTMTNIYLLLTLLFFVLWGALSSHNVSVPIVFEWLVLVNAFILHCYGQFALRKHTKSHDAAKSMVPRITDGRDVLRTMCFSLVFFVLCLVPFAPPWFCVEGTLCSDPQRPATGLLFWCFVLACALTITVELVLECTAEQAI